MLSSGLDASRPKLILSWVDHCCSAAAFQLDDCARQGQQRQFKALGQPLWQPLLFYTLGFGLHNGLSIRQAQ
jgi:hypothetical protein